MRESVQQRLLPAGQSEQLHGLRVTLRNLYKQHAVHKLPELYQQHTQAILSSER